MYDYILDTMHPVSRKHIINMYHNLYLLKLVIDEKIYLLYIYYYILDDSDNICNQLHIL